ncbi:hypothetical protein LSH36_429g01013 [Paralvinella palmiformis]|uniref:Uncharacterized protein n=1 Tax=Paralvinella palmiformis TaxID=53620 RepID=A0AAD9JBL5_9ANNE|nr:hypothetical protein LSH36_429g01013 [Paralvinella palmiformis]
MRPVRCGARWRHHRHTRVIDAWAAEWVSWIIPTPAVYLLAAYFVSSLLACPDQCTCPGSSNQVTCTSAGLTGIPRNLPPALTTLDLSQNQLHTLSAANLASLRNVVNLKLKDNTIEMIHNGAFEPMQSLQTLDLAANRLSALTPFTFRGATNLLHLDLSGNRITTIDGAFAGMAELSRLDLRNNNITDIGQDTFGELVNLRYLLLAENRISRIDRKAFRNLEKLTYLVLKGNPIGQVPRFQFNSFYLSYVDLSECGLTHVPRGLPNSIRYLQLRRNNITVIRHHSFQDCPFISILVLDENGLTEINERTFEHMTYLQQLWLNNNNLRRLPRHLPAGLQRLLMDQNDVQTLSGEPFADGSKLHTLSLMGNAVWRLEHDALGKLALLQSVDLSNNQLVHLYGQTFSNCSRLETLQLSKNPLQYFHSRCFHGLSSLQTLSLAYIPTVVSMHDDIFDDLVTVTKLDLDSSHWIIRTLLADDRLLSAIGSVEDLSMQSSDLTTLRADFFRFLPRLAMFHVSSARWHCDSSLIFFRNWLLTTKVRVEKRDELVCMTPRDLYGSSITSLADHQFVPATTLKYTTALPTAPGQLSTFPTTLHPPPPRTKTAPPASGTTEGGTTANGNDDWDEDYHDNEDSSEDDEDGKEADKKQVGPVFDLDDIFEEIYADYDDDASSSSSQKPYPYSSRYPTWEELMRQATPRPPTDSPADTPYDPNPLDGDRLQIRPLPETGYGGVPSLPPDARGSASADDDDNKSSSSSSSSTIIIIVATTISTVIIAGILIFVIVYLSRKNRDRQNRKRANDARARRKPKPKREAYQNGIKYKSRNDVLYFMPKNQEGSTSESLQTAASKEAMSLVPGRDINHEGPLRVYKWEDF